MADAVRPVSAHARSARRDFLRLIFGGAIALAAGASSRAAASNSPATSSAKSAANSAAASANSSAATSSPGAGATSSAAGPAVRFVAFSARPIADLGFAPRLGIAPQRVQFYPTARSARYEYRGRMPVSFVDTASGEVVAEATIPPEIREPLLLFTPADAAAGGKLRYKVSVLDDSVAHHPAGALAIVNLSGLALTGTLDDQPVAVKPGLNAPVNLSRPAKLALRTTFKNRAYPAYSGEVKLARNERGLLILFPPFYPGSLEVQARLLIDRR